MWFGHWRKGAAATLGEEHEQVFATVSKYGSVTRHMTKASMYKHDKYLRACSIEISNYITFIPKERENTLTNMVVYHNRKKENNMVSTLKKRLITVGLCNLKEIICSWIIVTYEINHLFRLKKESPS